MWRLSLMCIRVTEISGRGVEQIEDCLTDGGRERERERDTTASQETSVSGCLRLKKYKHIKSSQDSKLLLSRARIHCPQKNINQRNGFPAGTAEARKQCTTLSRQQDKNCGPRKGEEEKKTLNSLSSSLFS